MAKDQKSTTSKDRTAGKVDRAHGSYRERHSLAMTWLAGSDRRSTQNMQAVTESVVRKER